MIHQKILLFLSLFLLTFANPLKATININKQMLNGVVLQTQQYGSDLTVTFLPPSFRSHDGDIVFHFSTNAEDDKEVLSYKIINGKLIYYGNDGSKYRMTLLSTDNGSWIIAEEEDPDGDDTQFAFGKAEERVYTIKKRGVTHKNKKLESLTYTNDPSTTEEMIDQLTMQIYGRLDISMESRRDYIHSINRFLYTASLLMIKKHKIDIQLQEIRQHQMTAMAAPPQITGLMHAHDSIEKLDGRTVIDYDENKLTTMTELQQAFQIAINKSMEFQRINYASEQEREKHLSKIKNLLIQTGTAIQKDDFIRAETLQSKETYRYYKKLLDNSSVWCLIDPDKSQTKPLFYPKVLVIELLYRKYKNELSRSQTTYNSEQFSQRVKNFGNKSQDMKHQFNRNHLYDLQAKIARLKNHQL